MKTKMTEFEIVKRAIENTEDIYGDVLEDIIEECIHDKEILDDLDYYLLKANGTSLEFDKDKYNLENITKLQNELLERNYIKWIKVVVKDNTVSLDVSFDHELSTYDSLLFVNYVYAKLDYGF